MIRQRKNRAYLKKSTFKLENDLCLQGNVIKKPQSQENQVFQSGIFNNFLHLRINNKNTLSYTSKIKKNSSLNNNKSALCIKGENTSKRIFNKENQVESQIPISQSQQKMLLIQTTGNQMLSFKKFKRNEDKRKEKRPSTAVSSCRSSIHKDLMENSISRILQELNQNQAKRAQQKISTSQALVLYSKVLRTTENSSSREFYKKKLKNSSCERYNSFCIMTNKVKIERKNSQTKRKLDFKEYLHKYKLIGNKNGDSNLKPKKKDEDFDIGGWDTGDFQLF